MKFIINNIAPNTENGELKNHGKPCIGVKSKAITNVTSHKTSGIIKIAVTRCFINREVPLPAAPVPFATLIGVYKDISNLPNLI